MPTSAGTPDYPATESVVCIARDTVIGTPDGGVPIQDLVGGDMVLTRDRGAQPIRWIGSRTLPAIGGLAPVVVEPGTLGNDKALRVGPSHRLLIADRRAELMFGEPEVLVAARHLVDGGSVRIEECGDVEYYHLLFDRHEIVSANGAAAESFFPCELGLGWLEPVAREQIFALFPALRDDSDAYGPAARIALRDFEVRALTR